LYAADLLGKRRNRYESRKEIEHQNIKSIQHILSSFKPIDRGGWLLERFGDWIIMIAAAGVMLWWVFRRFDRWLHEPPGSKLRKLALAGGVEQDDTVALLQKHDYEVLSGKHRIPLGVVLDDGPVMPTRLYFDYLASKEDKYYLVKLERTRQPMDWTASGLREQLLVYALLCPDCEGIIIVNLKDQLLKIVRFKVEDGE
jgi:hypothetical protein